MQVDTNLNIAPDSLMFSDTSAFVENVLIHQAPTSFITESAENTFLNHTREKYSDDWITLLLLLGFILLATSKFLFRKRFNDLLKAFWGRNYSNQLMREGDIFKEQFGLIMFILHFVSSPLFYSMSIIYLLPNYDIKLNVLLFAQLASLSLILWAYRILFIKTTSIIFKTPKPSSEILTQLFIFNLLSGVLVLPFITLFYYSESSVFLIMGIVIWCFFQIYRFIRLFVVGFSYAIFSGLHLFLYLCTLEIVPIVILIKIVSKFYQ